MARSRQTVAEKIEAVFCLTQMTLEMAEAAERKRFPDASPRDIRLRVAARRYDRETMIKVFGWDPDEHPR